MNSKNLSEKLNYILNELEMNKKQFYEACKEINPYISKPTVLNVINGKNKSCPNLETIDTIIKVCQKSNHPLLKDISYNYLLNEKIINIIDKNAIINDNITLTDKSIDTISRLRKSLNTNRILNDLLENVDYNFWENLGYISSLTEIQKATHKLIKYDQSYHDKQNLIDIKINYILFKKEELEECKKQLSKKEYKNHLIKLLDCSEIFNNINTLEELEENYFKKLETFNIDLSEVFENFISNDGTISNSAYNQSDLEKFKIYLKSHYIYNSEYFDEYIKLFANMNTKFVISTIDFKDYLRYNFKSQHTYLKQINKYLKILKKYKEEQINLDLEEFEKISNFVYKLSELLMSLNKFFRLVTNEYMTDYFNLMN